MTLRQLHSTFFKEIQVLMVTCLLSYTVVICYDFQLTTTLLFAYVASYCTTILSHL